MIDKSTGASSPQTPIQQDSRFPLDQNMSQQMESRFRSCENIETPQTLPGDREVRRYSAVDDASALQRRLQNLNIPLKDVLMSSDLIAVILNEGGGGNGLSNDVFFDGGNIKARYEAEYNLVRVYSHKCSEVVNLKLSDDRRTVNSIVGYPSLTENKLDYLIRSNFLRPLLIVQKRATDNH